VNQDLSASFLRYCPWQLNYLLVITTFITQIPRIICELALRIERNDPGSNACLKRRRQSCRVSDEYETPNEEKVDDPYESFLEAELFFSFSVPNPVGAFRSAFGVSEPFCCDGLWIERHPCFNDELNEDINDAGGDGGFWITGDWRDRTADRDGNL
jgi:hypothetical protein